MSDTKRHYVSQRTLELMNRADPSSEIPAGFVGLVSAEDYSALWQKHREQHNRDSAELRGLCASRDQARKERDTLAHRCRELEKDNANTSARLTGMTLDRNYRKDECIALRAEVERLRQFVEFVRHATVSSGVCCCGDDMSRHGDPMACGHMPVDAWDHALLGWLEQLGVEP